VRRIATAATSGALILLPYLALGQGQPILPITRLVVSGVETPVAINRPFDRTTCASRKVAINVTRQPDHGKISVLEQDAALPESTPRSGSTGQCAGKFVKAKILVYKSDAGFVGVDAFAYEAIGEDGTRAPYEGTITVIAANAGGTTPSAAAGTTYRMLIQSPPELGGKCIDIPSARFLVGMRLQMWGCNNSPSQIFLYNEQDQELKIGDKCVETWGRGDAQDAVGLGDCDGGARQHWKMKASKDFYQIIGINDRCLELRYAVKDEGAPLDIQDCDAGRPWRLWALVEAP
jgi:hypothetical protein